MGHSVAAGTRKARDGMHHYRAREGSDEQLAEQRRLEARRCRLARRDEEYRRALGVAIKEALPKVLGNASAHGRARVGGNRIRESRPGVSVPAARHGH